MFIFKRKNSFLNYLMFSLLFLFLAFTFFSIYFESGQSKIILYLTILFSGLFVVSALIFSGKFFGDFLRSLKMLFIDKDDKSYNLNLSHATCQVVDVKSWHDKNANAYTEIWIKKSNDKEDLIRLTNSGIGVRKNHTISIIYDTSDAVAIFNHASNNVYPINNRNAVIPLWLSAILLFLLICFSFLFLGAVGLIIFPIVIMILAKRKIKKIRFKRDWDEITRYLKTTNLTQS